MGCTPLRPTTQGCCFKRSRDLNFFNARLYFVIKQVLPSCYLSSEGGYCLYLRMQHFFLGKESHWNYFFSSLLKWAVNHCFLNVSGFSVYDFVFYKAIAFKGCSTEFTYFYVFYFSSYDLKKYMNVSVEVGRFSMHWICVVAFSTSCWLFELLSISILTFW